MNIRKLAASAILLLLFGCTNIPSAKTTLNASVLWGTSTYVLTGKAITSTTAKATLAEFE